MVSEQLNIDPESPALQYRVLDRGDVWVLERATPGYPRTPDENRAVCEAKAVLETDDRDRIVVTPALQERIDAGHGDTISLVVVVNACCLVFVDEMQSAINPILEAMADVAKTFTEDFAEAMSSAFTLDEPSDDRDRDAQLPESVRAARERREQQRETDRQATGAHYPDGDPDAQ